MALHILFLLYAVNCMVFYQDRMIVDAIAWLNGHLLAQDAFFLRRGRAFIQLPPQILPWLAIQAGLPLKGVALAYSLGFCLYHYLMALLLYYGFRRHDLATLLVLVIVLHLVHNNFYVIADGMHIIPWALCLLAVLQYPAQSLSGRILVALGAAVFAVITASSHLFGLPLSLALGGYVFFASGQRKRLVLALIIMAAALLVYYAWHSAGMDKYESGKMGQIGLQTLRKNGLNFVRYFVFAHGYAFAGVLLLGAFGWFHASRRAACWFSALCTLGYAAMIAAYMPLGDRFIHLYYWHCMTPMYAIMAVPFFDARGATPGGGALSRCMLAVALVWAVIGTAADLSALRERTAFQTHLVNALGEDGKRLFIVDASRFSRDNARAFAPDFLQDETSARTAYADPAKTTILMSSSMFAAGSWTFSPKWAAIRSRYLPWLPLKKEAFSAAIVPASRGDILQQAAQVSLNYPERPADLRVIDGWLSNYLHPPRVVYNVPVAVINRGDRPLAACDTEGTPVMFGYYWHRDGKILFQDLKAEYLPINVKTTFQHAISVQRAGIPRNARLTIDLFLNGRPLLHPETYYGLIPGTQGVIRKTQSESVIDMQTGFYDVEKAGVWLARQARFAFNRDLRRCAVRRVPALARRFDPEFGFRPAE